MAQLTRSPLSNQADFEHALSEVERLLETPPKPQTAEDRYFGQLLTQIADYHDAQPPTLQSINLDRLQDLDRQMNAFGKRWPHPDGESHWSPLLGGDVDPRHQIRSSH
ncbi:MAG: superoxide dismutase, partial [Phenylobacterium sp.]|nr:superoxide dismutase [Phenylobacterium sp.]